MKSVSHSTNSGSTNSGSTNIAQGQPPASVIQDGDRNAAAGFSPLDSPPLDSVSADLRGVIWISGYSAAGKTTVARVVQRQLNQGGCRTILLDGDDLRSIFAEKWGYERAERVELAKVYFRLCSTLAAQGNVVIISAVAMYDEVRRWMKENVPGSLEVYLDVPEEERRRRDRATKQVYRVIGSPEALYDPPVSPDLVVENHGEVEASEAARKICDFYRSHAASPSAASADLGRERHWNAFYATAAAPATPSPFAVWVNERLPAGSRGIEVGCGNGRDACHFARHGHSLYAFDLSSAAIDLDRERYADLGIEFRCGRLEQHLHFLPQGLDFVYSRFVLHAMPVEEEITTLAAAQRVLRPGGLLFIECRSINDPLAREGEVLSPTERIHGHYRRFIVREELEERLAQAGFRLLHGEEGRGLAVFGDEDPVVIRLVGEKSLGR